MLILRRAPTPRRVTRALAARGRHWRTRTILERDLWSFRRRYGEILGPAPPTRNGVVLIASLTHSVFQLKLEGMLAKAFQLKGLEPVAAVPSESDLPRRYLEVYGIRRFVTLAEHADGEVDRRARREAEALLAGIATTAALKDLTFRGASVGRQVLSTISRHLHEGALDVGEPRTRQLVCELLPEAIRTTLAAEALLDAVSPDAVLFCERNYTGEGPLSDLALARRLNVIQFVSGFEDDALVFKRYTSETKGMHPRAVSEESWPQIAAMPWSERHERELEEDFSRRFGGDNLLSRWHQGWTRRQSREEIAAQLRLDTRKPTAVLFSHVLWDANMFYGRDLFADQEEWFVETVRAACENDGVNWIVKLHPANVWKLRRDRVAGRELDEHVAIREHVGELPSHVRVLEPGSEISTWSLFGVTDVGVTIRGSVGFELPCLGKPVLTAGTGFYSGRGFTVDSQSAGEYLERVRRIGEILPPTEEQVLLARKHAYALFRLRQARFTTFRAVYRSVDEVDHPFEATIEINPRTAEELAAAADLRRFGDWAVDSRALDYLDGQIVRVDAG